jgi:hypothetical protein
MKLFWLYFLILPPLLLGQAGWRLLVDSPILLFGTAIPIQLAIYAVLKFPVFRSVRACIAGVFFRLPVALGFSLLVSLGVGAISTVALLSQKFTNLSDPWAFVTLGFLLGIMGPIFHSMKHQKNYEARQSNSY